MRFDCGFWSLGVFSFFAKSQMDDDGGEDGEEEALVWEDDVNADVDVKEADATIDDFLHAATVQSSPVTVSIHVQHDTPVIPTRLHDELQAYRQALRSRLLPRFQPGDSKVHDWQTRVADVAVVRHLSQATRLASRLLETPELLNQLAPLGVDLTMSDTAVQANATHRERALMNTATYAGASDAVVFAPRDGLGRLDVHKGLRQAPSPNSGRAENALETARRAEFVRRVLLSITTDVARVIEADIRVSCVDKKLSWRSVYERHYGERKRPHDQAREADDELPFWTTTIQRLSLSIERCVAHDFRREWQDCLPPREDIERLLCLAVETILSGEYVLHAGFLGALHAAVASDRPTSLQSTSLRDLELSKSTEVVRGLTRWLLGTETKTARSGHAASLLKDTPSVALISHYAMRCVWSYASRTAVPITRVIRMLLVEDERFRDGGCTASSSSPTGYGHRPEHDKTRDATFQFWFDHYAMVKYRIIDNKKEWRIFAAEVSRAYESLRLTVEKEKITRRITQSWLDVRYGRNASSQPVCPTLRELYAVDAPLASWETKRVASATAAARTPNIPRPGDLLHRAVMFVCSEILGLADNRPPRCVAVRTLYTQHNDNPPRDALLAITD